MGPGRQVPADPVDVAVEAGVLDDAVIRGKLIGRALPVKVDFLAFRHHHQLLPAGDRINGTATEQLPRSQGAGADTQQTEQFAAVEEEGRGNFFAHVVFPPGSDGRGTAGPGARWFRRLKRHRH